MTTASVIIAPAPRSEPQPFTEPQAQTPRHLRLVPSPQLTIDDLIDQRPLDDTGRQLDGAPSRHADLPEAAVLIRGFFLAVTEVLVGRRSAEQLGRNATLEVMSWLRQARPHQTRSATSPPPQIRKVHVCVVRDGVNEATAIIQHGPYVRAMNARFVGLDGRWQCVRLELI
ncbi:Rv3235 family protein [Cumulibacter soli]|uniref:Rv3235 family protein n=1 Tax=Cumulibacter soli TaxID=2546344 RepID=UPI00106852E4|nr:Rv3235 family protein [Cumulibacter soli]